MVQNVVVDLILADSVISKDFTILQILDNWITDTSASNDGTPCKKGSMKLRKDESSCGTMKISGKAINKWYLCDIQNNFVTTPVKKR